MSHSDVFNWPPFAVPPDAPQLALYLERTGGSLDAAGWACAGADGTDYLSAAVYFGALALRPSGATERERHLREVLVLPPDVTVRLDYACTAERTLLLRFGIPGQAPCPFAAAADEALAKAEGFIDDFLARDFRSILLCRSTEPVGEDLLFAGETEFYEGFLGREGLPLAVTDRNGDGSCVLEGSLRALIG